MSVCGTVRVAKDVRRGDNCPWQKQPLLRLENIFEKNFLRKKLKVSSVYVAVHQKFEKHLSNPNHTNWLNLPSGQKSTKSEITEVYCEIIFMVLIEFICRKRSNKSPQHTYQIVLKGSPPIRDAFRMSLYWTMEYKG